jgi:hypothetical protein
LKDVIAGVLLLLTAILFWHVVWSLLAWGFTLTLLTALAQAHRPLNREEWISAYMKGGNLSTFVHNRLRLLVGSGLVEVRGDIVVATNSGILVAQLVRFVRFILGLDGQ